MKELGLKAIYPGPKTSQPNKKHKKYPYLLRGLEIQDKSCFCLFILQDCTILLTMNMLKSKFLYTKYINQVWSSDITYIKYRGSYMYLVAIIDIYTRKVLSWRLSNTMDSHFYRECLNEAISFFGTPEIFNTDQGSQLQIVNS